MRSSGKELRFLKMELSLNNSGALSIGIRNLLWIVPLSVSLMSSALRPVTPVFVTPPLRSATRYIILDIYGIWYAWKLVPCVGLVRFVYEYFKFKLSNILSTSFSFFLLTIACYHIKRDSVTSKV